MYQGKIGIIGASIVGTTCAVLLCRAGFDITVFEQRAPNRMDDQGAGLVLPCELIHQLKQQNLLALVLFGL